MTAPEGQIFDLGYQNYDGPREGRMRARKALFVNGVRTSFPFCFLRLCWRLRLFWL